MFLQKNYTLTTSPNPISIPNPDPIDPPNPSPIPRPTRTPTFFYYFAVTSVVDPDFELRRGPGFNLLAQTVLLLSVISSFFTQNMEGAWPPRAPRPPPDLPQHVDHLNSTPLTKVNRGDWLERLANIKGTSKDATIILCWKVHDPAQSFVLQSYTMHELRNQHVSIG